jgi:ribosome-associated protein
MGRKRKTSTDKLTETIIDAIKEKKGKDILKIDLAKLTNPVCKQFIICHADSNTQVNAIAEMIEVAVKKSMSERAWKKEGTENAQWIILDYVDVVVHVFQSPYREYYSLEKLWADGSITTVV